MLFVEGDNTIYFDVDNTLIMWDPPVGDPRIVHLPSLHKVYVGTLGKSDITTPDTVEVIPHLHHLEMIKRHKQLGNTVIVWSKSGPRWARNVVEFFELQEYVDLCIGKPSCFYDDLRAEEFMVDRRYIIQS